MRHLGDVEATGRHVGRDQHMGRAGAERGQGPLTLPLALVAVDRGDLVAPLVQKHRKLFRPVLGAPEHDRQLARVLGKVVRQQRGLVALVHEVDPLRDLVGGLAGRVHRHADRIGQVAFGKLLHQLRHGGREQHRRAFRRDQARDAAQRVDEADVEHLVGLVQHQVTGLVEADRAALDQVDQAAGGRDQHVDAAREAVHLHVDRGAADHAEGADAGALGEALDVLGDLGRKLARGREDQRSAGAGFGATALGQKPGQHRQAERRRLAGAGLGKAHDVAPVDQRRDRLRLDRGRFGQAEVGQVDRHARVDAHAGEGRVHVGDGAADEGLGLGPFLLGAAGAAAGAEALGPGFRRAFGAGATIAAGLARALVAAGRCAAFAARAPGGGPAVGRVVGGVGHVFSWRRPSYRTARGRPSMRNGAAT